MYTDRRDQPPVAPWERSSPLSRPHTVPSTFCPGSRVIREVEGLPWFGQEDVVGAN